MKLDSGLKYRYVELRLMILALLIFLMMIQALVILADNAKHNQTGRTDEFGALRHRVPELCSIGALAFLFFAIFHIQEPPNLDFKPDFSDKNYGEYGRRDWYRWFVFTTTGITSPMSYESTLDSPIIFLLH